MPNFSPSRLRIVIGLILALAFVGATVAHPLGNFTISHFVRLAIGAERVNVRYVVDMAEVSTFQELDKIDSDGDRSPSRGELAAYAERAARQYADAILLTVDGLRVPMRMSARKAALLSGDGGLPILRVECDFTGNLPENGTGAARRLRFEDANRNDRSGWRELVVTPEAGVAVFDSAAFGNGITDELKAYPKDMLTLPLNERIAEMSFIQGEIPPGAAPLRTRDGRPVEVKQRDRLAELIAVPELTWQTALLGLLIAAMLGGLHSLSPGHGKAVVGAYLIGSRGTAKHAAFLGLTVTVTHTAGVFALGLVTLFGSKYIVPEKLFPVLTLLSGVTVLVVGLQQLISRWRKASNHHHHHHSNEVHDHSHDHSDDHRHTHSHGGHSHSPPARVTWRSLLALGVSGGLLPCPSALVVLLSAIALHRVGYGLLLVLAFSAGLAGALTCVGLLFIHARRFVERPAFSGAGLLVRAMPVLSALVITCAGAAICYGAIARQEVNLPRLIASLRVY